MRIAALLIALAGMTVAGYIGVAGYLLAKVATGLLTVGTVTAALEATERPTDPLALGYRGDPLVALGLPFQTITLETPLGPTDAWLVPATGPEAGRAVYVHGIAGAREDGYRHLSMLNKAGWSVLLITYRNDPDAPPDPGGTYGFGLLEWPDLEAAVARMTPDAAGPGVLVVAESMGGAVLGQFLARSPLSGRIRAVALDSPAISFSAVLDHLATQSGKPLPKAFAAVARRLVAWQTGLDLAQAEVAPVYQAFPGPLFIAHGSGDRLVPIAPSQGLAASRSGPTLTLWTGADHLGSFNEDPAAYDKTFRDFLDGLTD